MLQIQNGLCVLLRVVEFDSFPINLLEKLLAFKLDVNAVDKVQYLGSSRTNFMVLRLEWHVLLAKSASNLAFEGA